jgi:hypothetical protein
MEFNYISLLEAERLVKEQFAEPDDRQRPDRPDTRPERLSRTVRLRLATGRALHALANAIDPAPARLPRHQQ